MVEGGPETGAFIQCINGREPQIHVLWCHGIDRICHKVLPYQRIEIPDGTVGEFVTDYISKNGRRNQIIGELSINGSVKLIRISEIWIGKFPFIPDPRSPYYSVDRAVLVPLVPM